MAADFLQVEDLPRQNATQVKNGWGDLVRQVRATGSVAVTHHNKIEMVVMDAERYRELTALVEQERRSRQAALDQLSARFDARLAVLQSPDTPDKIRAILDSGGDLTRLARRPKAGGSF